MRELAVIGDTGGAELPALVAGQGSLRPCASCPSSLNSRSRSSGFGRGQNDGTGRRAGMYGLQTARKILEQATSAFGSRVA